MDDGSRRKDEPRVRFRRSTKPRSKFGSLTHVILLGAALAVIIWLIFFLKDSSLLGGGEGGETGRTPVVRGSGLDIDENLINYFDEGIQLLRPDRNWEFAYGTGLRHGGAGAFGSVRRRHATARCR